MRVLRFVLAAALLPLLGCESPAASEVPTNVRPEPGTGPVSRHPQPQPSSNLSQPAPTGTFGREQEAVVAVVDEFFTTWNALMKDPQRPFDELAALTGEDTPESYVNDPRTGRSDDVVQLGDMSWEIIAVGVPEAKGKRSSVPVTVCTDASSVDLVELDTGASVLPADDPARTIWEMNIVSRSSGWKVGKLSRQAVGVCPSAR